MPWNPVGPARQSATCGSLDSTSPALSHRLTPISRIAPSKPCRPDAHFQAISRPALPGHSPGSGAKQWAQLNVLDLRTALCHHSREPSVCIQPVGITPAPPSHPFITATGRQRALLSAACQARLERRCLSLCCKTQEVTCFLKRYAHPSGIGTSRTHGKECSKCRAEKL
jgi:hypothetical protein